MRYEIMKKIKSLSKEITALFAMWVITDFEFDCLTIVVSLIIIGYGIYHLTGAEIDNEYE